MKHFYTFIVAMLVLASCSKNDDNSSSSNPTQLTPPEWLYGTWQLEGRDVFRFSEGKVYLTVDENHPLMSFDEYYKLSKAAGEKINVQQKISTNQYVVWEENSGWVFNFRKDGDKVMFSHFSDEAIKANEEVAAKYKTPDLLQNIWQELTKKQ